jgi:hypothetical protein
VAEEAEDMELAEHEAEERMQEERTLYWELGKKV